MNDSIRRQLLVLWTLTVVSLAVLAVLAVVSWRTVHGRSRVPELTVERVNLVESDGRIRMVAIRTARLILL